MLKPRNRLKVMMLGGNWFEAANLLNALDDKRPQGMRAFSDAVVSFSEVRCNSTLVLLRLDSAQREYMEAKGWT